MDCVCCGSAAVTERPERTAQGYRRFRCRTCAKEFNERSTGVLNRAQYPSDVIALVVLWRLRYRLTLRDLCEMFGLLRRYPGGTEKRSTFATVFGSMPNTCAARRWLMPSTWQARRTRA